MFKSLFVSLVLTTVSSQAAIFECPKSKQITIEGVSCCLERLTEDQCRDAIQSLSQEAKVQVDACQKQVTSQRPSPKANQEPNAFWSALAYYRESLAKNPQNVNDTQFGQILRRGFAPIHFEAARSGDLLVFQGDFKQKFKDVDTKILQTLETSRIVHSGIFISPNFIFQKGDAQSDFSIDSIAAVEKGLTPVQKPSASVTISVGYYKINP